ncbi:hypothetical protein Lal_00046972 [Lupinus albus]|nr:hypothetical protein Lal_00046972 [Lupinus albus]
MTTSMSCKIGVIPFLYFGISVRANPRSNHIWKNSIWLIRNDVVFSAEEGSYVQVMNLIKNHSWSWFCSLHVTKSYDFKH